MNREQDANNEDRIQFVIALMTRDYAKVRDLGNRLLKRNRNDTDVIRTLNILKQKSQHKIEESERLSSIDSPIKPDNECGGSDATDGEDFADFVDDYANSRIDPGLTSKIAPREMFTSSIDRAKTNLDFKQRMHRVIPITINKGTA